MPAENEALDSSSSVATVVHLPTIKLPGTGRSYLFFLLDAARGEALQVTSLDPAIASAVPGPYMPSVLVTSVAPGSTRIFVRDTQENAWLRTVVVEVA